MGHNIKFDLCSIWKYLGELPQAPFVDTINAAYLINSSMKGQYKLGMCVKRELGFIYDKSMGKDIAAQPFKETAHYSRLDSLYTWLLWTQVYEQQIPQVQRVFDVEADLVDVLCRHGAGGRAPRHRSALPRCTTTSPRSWSSCAARSTRPPARSSTSAAPSSSPRSSTRSAG